MRRILKMVGGLILLGLLGLGGFVLWHQVLLTRLLTYPENPITDTNWYTPQEPVTGNLQVPLPTATTAERTIPTATLEAVADVAYSRNSVALLVMHQGKLVLERYWQGHGRDSTTNSQSLAKTVLALLIGIAIEEGQIQSELDPVRQYVPEWGKDLRSQITIQDLLQMQSGLRNDLNIKNPFSDLLQMYGGPDATGIALGIPALRPAGQRYEYNNVNSQILGLVLERATGQRYANYLSSRLWQPLGAKTASLWLDREGGNAKPFCCLFTRARDWARVGQLMLNAGRVGTQQVVPQRWLTKMRTPSQRQVGYGYHLRLAFHQKRAAEPPLDPDIFYLDGLGRQMVYVLPQYELVVVRLGEYPRHWDDAALINPLVRSLQPQTSKATTIPTCVSKGGFYIPCVAPVRQQ